jgi:Sulfotransferase family
VTVETRTADASPAGAQLSRDRHRAPPVTANPASKAPVVVLALAYSGASTLRAMLDGHPALACTSGTGLLPLCEQAMATWRNADARPTGLPSALARSSTRALAATVITSILAREGKPRWCEVAVANPEAAEAFLQLYPETQFLCMYRACPGVIRAALDASPWGITDPVFAPFVRAHPVSTVAGLTAYWVMHTRSLLAFEHAHPRACLRVRFEDLVDDQPQAEDRVMAFLGAGPTDGRAGPGRYSQTQPAPQDTDLAGFPDHLVPPALRAQADDLLRELDYPVMTASQSP